MYDEQFLSLRGFTRPLHLLYVEDNEEVRTSSLDLFDLFFENITLCSDGQEGVEAFRTGDYDLIITDINMPRMNGLQMIQAIRETDSKIPILVLSAHNDTEYLLRSIELDIDAYLQKPISNENFMNKLEKVVSGIRKSRALTKTLSELKQHKDIIDRSSIVSKTDIKGNITYVNDMFCKLSGYSREELLGKPHSIVRHPDMPASTFEELWNTIKVKKEPWFGQIKNRSKLGKAYYVDSIVNPVFDDSGELCEFIALRYDITDLISPKKKLLDEIGRMQKPFLLIAQIEDYQILRNFYDDDTVQKIEDKFEQNALGHFRPRCKFNRIFTLGDGRFAFLKNALDLSSKAEHERDLKYFQNSVKENVVKLGDYEYDVNIIISYATQKEKLFENTMLGLEFALRSKKDFVHADGLVESEQEQASKNMATIKMIKKAISEDKIISLFQPIVNTRTGEIEKYESLVRLINDDDEIISPFFFLDVAKKGKYYQQITDIVIENSFRQLLQCDKEISINLSAIDIEEDKTREKVMSLLEKHKEEADRLVFELLEDENTKDFAKVKAFIMDVKAYGVQIAIDDFGAGYSNFERLMDFQPDIVKIDGSLIKNIDISQQSRDVIETIYAFALKQGMKTVAEFVSNKQIHEVVLEIGIDYSQGFYFGKPERLDTLKI